jgi:soluble lytic murein transglycosylase
MPRVPTYDNFQAQANTLPQVRLEAPQIQDIAGQQLQQSGQQMQRAGQQIGQIAINMQEQANQVRVNDALNKAKELALRLEFDNEAGFRNLKGINAIERPGGKALEQEYGETFERDIGEIAGGLANDAQRQAFMANAQGMTLSLRERAMRHEADEFKTHSLSVAEGIQATAIREIELNWRDPGVIQNAVTRIRAETYRQANLLGKSAEWQEAQARKLTSNAHKTALLASLEANDPAYADAYLRKFSEQMDGDDILAVRGHVTKAMDARVGSSVAAEVIGKMAPRIQTGDVERAFNILVGTESNGRQFDKDGKPLTSSAGAIGIAQVMPGTGPEAAKLAGLQWDDNRYRNDPDYNRALGMAYFQEQLRTNGGDLRKAFAAYNAGPGRLQEAIKKAERNNRLAENDPAIPMRSYVDFLPTETKNYIAKNMREFEAGQGQNKRPTMLEIDEQLRADPRLADNPARYQAAREAAERQLNEQTKAIKQREEEAVATAMRGIIENGGRYSDLPVSIRAALPPKEVDNLIGFAQKISKGDDSTSPLLYQKLASAPDMLARLSDNEFFALRRELSESDFKHFAQERGKLNGGQGGGGAGNLNTEAINRAINHRLHMLKEDPTPKDGSSDAARIGGMRKFVNDYFLTAQREAGKKFSDAEVVQHIDQLFAMNTTLRGFFSNSSGAMLNMKAGDIPKGERQAIESAFKRNGVDSPTDAQILDIYWKRQLAKK